MYALRDVTGTVPSIPLIVGSIISKKIAGGADAIVLDVKVGSGAFMKTETDARQLAHELAAVGEALGRQVVCIMSDMDQPLGMAVGNAIEVAEAIDTLKGRGPAELTELVMVFGAKMLVLGERAANEVEARAMLIDAIDSGRAIEVFRQWVAAQGGDARVADDPGLLPMSECSREIRSSAAGYVARFDAEGVGRAAMLLGAGRAQVDDVIDPGAGLLLAVRVGDAIAVGDPLCTMYAATETLLDLGEERFRHSIHIGAEPVAAPPLFHEL
jgi:pyrimidine-nucleoside phosphorylase